MEEYRDLETHLWILGAWFFWILGAWFFWCVWFGGSVENATKKDGIKESNTEQKKEQEHKCSDDQNDSLQVKEERKIKEKR